MKRVMKAVALCVLASVMLTGCNGTKNESGGKGTSPQTTVATGATGETTPEEAEQSSTGKQAETGAEVTTEDKTETGG